MPPDKLPEEFAPTGPKLSKFPIQPAPPIRPQLLADEARFALRLALLVGATEFLAWLWLAGGSRGVGLLALGVLRSLKPVWARLGTRLSRVAVALTLLVGSIVLGVAAAILANRFMHGDVVTQPFRILWSVAIAAVGLPALADLCSTCIADSVTVERRAAAFAWLDVAQALGALLGVAFAPLLSVRSPLSAFLALWSLAIFLACVGIGALRDRGTPRSAWPAATYFSMLQSPLARNLGFLALVAGVASMKSLHATPLPIWNGLPLIPEAVVVAIPRWLQIAAPVAGMALAARLDRLTPNAIVIPRVATGLAVVGWVLAVWPLALFALGMMFAALPAAVARGAGEMERPVVSSLAWSALILGAAVGAVV